MSARTLAARGAMFGTLAAGILLAVVIAAFLHLMEPRAHLSLASFAAVIALAYGAFAYFIFMTKADRELVSSVLARRNAS
ncbi:hypothetical protein G3545_14930 [Starkeya sp. ORNL1]|uniref:hypothetical protein n=1 Tax=Starkeya sp. ORNL1 TaxID=2709380 RepID=UPI001464043E|nr:hypothetical protein [Starkeya sp. ORNL1]QJP14826.1 hypothetical protein G3545_14930 [Starkeya sp. ORNL1]